MDDRIPHRRPRLRRAGRLRRSRDPRVFGPPDGPEQHSSETGFPPIDATELDVEPPLLGESAHAVISTVTEAPNHWPLALRAPVELPIGERQNGEPVAWTLDETPLLVDQLNWDRIVVGAGCASGKTSLTRIYEAIQRLHTEQHPRR